MNKKIGIIGTGNVGWHLAHLFTQLHLPLAYIGARNKDKAQKLADQVGVSEAGLITECPSDLAYIIIAVSDSAIQEVSALLPKNSTIIHTSGSADILEIQSEHKGVLWTIQTLKIDQPTEYSKLPFIVEFTKPADEEYWTSLLMSHFTKVYVRNSEQRRKAHLAAVLCNNFVNHLYTISEQILGSIELPFSLLYPIIEEESKKVQLYSPQRIQTGPASRGDEKTIQAHLKLLNETPEYASLYSLFSQLIKQNNDTQL